IRGEARGLEAMPGDGFQRAAGEAGAVGGEEEGGFGRGELEPEEEEVLEIVLDLETAPAGAAGEGRWVQDEGVEFLAAAREARKDLEDVVGQEGMPGGGEAVEGEIFPAAVERFSGEIEAYGARSGQGGDD